MFPLVTRHIGCADMNVVARRRARIVALRHPACPGLSDEIARSAQQEDKLGSKTRYLSFTRLERRKSLMERLCFVSCCSAQVKAMTSPRIRSCSSKQNGVFPSPVKGRPCAASALGGGRLTERALGLHQAHDGGGRPVGALPFSEGACRRSPFGEDRCSTFRLPQQNVPPSVAAISPARTAPCCPPA